MIPWTNLIVRRDGSAHFCCDVFPELTVNGRIANVSRDALDDVWNADELVRVRAAMARAEQPAACATCWKREAEGGISRRLFINPVYRAMGGALAGDDVTREGADTGYRLERKPDWFILELGNVCNFKCRSCNARSSSRIATDVVQRSWTGETASQPHGGSWFENVDAVADMMASTGHEMLTLSLLGGEPFLIKETWRLLEALVARGIAQRTNVGLVTNGHQRAAQVEQLAPLFRVFNVTVSIDGYGALNEYLRHGCRWPQLVENLAWLRTIPNVQVVITPTLQNANVLDMPALLRFVDGLDLPLGYNVLTEPARLAPANLPPPVRRIAGRRLRAYLDAECKPVNRAIVQLYCDVLDENGDDFDPVLFREFAAFTNDLDAARGERLSAVAPELVALIRFAGVPWPEERRHVPVPRCSFDPAVVLQRMNRTVSPDDAIFAVPGADAWYFDSAPLQLAEIDALLREHGHPGLAGSRAVADYASHYGRTTRALRAALPDAAVYACDIDPDAVRFCAEELGALPVITGWRPDEDRLPGDLDAVTCISLLTHTPLEHWRRTLRAWRTMLRPGGVVAFTYLSEQRIAPWLDGAMEHYGSYSAEARAAVERAVRDGGFGFAPIPGAYGDESSYGIAFATAEVVRHELAAAGLEVIATPGDAGLRFAQDLALARRPDAPAPSASRERDVRLVALYDPRCYAPDAGEGAALASTWARLIVAEPAPPLPTELGFADPRVAEVRERQASLAREHGIDAFCYRYGWSAGGPVWDAPLRELVASGRPAFPFCLMIDVEDGVTVAPEDARSLFETIAEALADPRYVRVDGAPVLVVSDLAPLAHARGVAKAWRDAAAARGFALHLTAPCANPALTPHDMGFDSFIASSREHADPVAAAAASLADPRPPYRSFRAVAARRAAEAGDPELYELELRAAIDASRARGETVVFLDAWNDWLGGRYLEPDDRDGRAMLLATRRAALGPAGARVLLRRLRDALGDAGASVTGALDELSQAVARREDTLDRVLAAAEATLARDRAVPREAPAEPRATAVRHAYLEHVAGVDGALFTRAPIPLRGDRLRVRGWAHVEHCDPAAVELFLALEAFDGREERLLRIGTRVPREDVTATFPDYPPGCGFDVELDVRGLAAGLYRLALVQVTADARFRDGTAAVIEPENVSCSNA